MQSVQQQRSFSTAANAHTQGALIQHKVLPKCYVIGGVSGSGKRYKLRLLALPAIHHACLKASMLCSTVGRMLASRMQCPFYEGDDYHPQSNKGKPCHQLFWCICLPPSSPHGDCDCADKMHSGIPLQDEDRWPWLHILAEIIHQHIVRYTSLLPNHLLTTMKLRSDGTVLVVCRDELAVVACSALKQKYRDILSGQKEEQEHVKDVAFVSACLVHTALHALLDNMTQKHCHECIQSTNSRLTYGKPDAQTHCSMCAIGVVKYTTHAKSHSDAAEPSQTRMQAYC